jgi:hypothetical protein
MTEDDRRSPVPGYAAEGAFARSQEEFTRLTGWLEGLEAAGAEHAGLEEQLMLRGREMLRLMLQDHLSLRAVREQRMAVVAGADGTARWRAERGHSRTLSTVFGPVVVSRIAYRAPGAPNVHLADEQLNLPPEVHSHGLRRIAAAGAARGSLAGAAAAAARAAGVRLGSRQVQELARRAAADFDGFYASRRPLPGAAPGDVLCLSCDGKGILMRPDALRPRAARKARRSVPKQDGRLSRGEVRTRKRVAEVGAVFDITPVPRTAGQILAPGPRPPAPRASGKWLTASVTSDAADVVAGVFAEASRRDPGHQRTWIALADGNKDQIRHIQAQAAARGIAVTIICDFIHVLEYLWTAAWSFFPEASPDAGPWVRTRAAAILSGQARQVAAAIRDAAAALPPAQRKAAGKTAGYLDAKAPYLGYPTALAAGWPISTGVIEGACRYLIKDRMDITGARWGLDTAEAILKIRALHANHDFDAYWTCHLQRERQRNYRLAA